MSKSLNLYVSFFFNQLSKRKVPADHLYPDNYSTFPSIPASDSVTYGSGSNDARVLELSIVFLHISQTFFVCQRLR